MPTPKLVALLLVLPGMAACTTATSTVLSALTTQIPPAALGSSTPGPISTLPSTALPTLTQTIAPEPPVEPLVSTGTVSSPGLVATGTAVIMVTQPVEPAVYSFQPWELVTALAWSPDGRWLAASAGENVALFSAKDLRLADIQPAGAFSPGLAFSPDSQNLAAAGRDGNLRIWQLEPSTGEQQASLRLSLTLAAHKKGANAVAFSPDGTWLASGGNDALAKVWDVQTGKLVQSMIGGTFVVPNLAFTPDGAALAIINGDTIRLREVQSGRIIASIRAEAAFYSLAFSPDGRYLAAGDGENSLRVWETGAWDGDPAYTWQAHEGKPGTAGGLVWAVTFQPDGNLLATGGGDGAARLWSVDGKALREFIGHTRAVTCLAFDPLGTRLATGSLDATIRIWSLSP